VVPLKRSITPKERGKILFVYTSMISFIHMDLEVLERRFNVKKMKAATFLVPGKGKDPLEFLRLLKRILSADVVYHWFADLNAFFIVFFCILLRKKCIIVAGGGDVVKVPEIGYGFLLNSIDARMVKFVLDHATKILPFSEYAKEKVLAITRKSNIDLIHACYDSRRFKPSKDKKENIVVTVCLVHRENITRKGLNTFIESARYLPFAKFVLIGSHVDDAINYLKKLSPSNVEFTGSVSEEELVKWYQRAKVYCQLSYEEGAGIALREAMACECIPVVSLKAKALRESVGEHGFYVPYGDVEATVKAVKEALSASREMGAKARRRVEDLFSIEKREKALLRTINDIAYAPK